MEKDIIYQQKLVWDRIIDGLKAVDEANASLESRATKILGGSTAAIAFVVGVNAVPASFRNLNGWEVLCLGILCISVIVMYCCATHAWAPWTVSIPGSTDVMALFDKYISKDRDTAFNNALIDAADCLKDSVAENKKKGQAVRWMFIVLQAQMLMLAVTITVKWVTQAT